MADDPGGLGEVRQAEFVADEEYRFPPHAAPASLEPFECEAEFTLAELAANPNAPRDELGNVVVAFEREADRRDFRFIGSIAGQRRDDRAARVEIGRGTSGHLNIVVGAGGHDIRIGRAARLVLDLRLWRRSTLSIGDGTTVNGARVICDHTDIVMGADGLCSDEVLIQGHDQHGRFDPVTGMVLNGARTRIEIGEHVWLGRRSTVMPGARIGQGALIALGAVVTGTVQPFCVAGGVPARRIGPRQTWLRGIDRANPVERAFLERSGFPSPRRESPSDAMTALPSDAASL